MPVPSYRVPVVVARGTIAALTAGLASLQEGEICYATDEDTLYVVEGGVLTEATGTGAGSLQDVIDDTSPQLGGDLDVNGFEFISTAAGNIVFTPDTTGVIEIKGNTGNDAAIQLNCEANTHGIKLKSPPHSAAASYTLVFPGDTGTTGQALTTDGSGGLSWATPSTVGSIDDLSDVDTTTVAPADGQALVWDNTAGQWEPGTASTVGSIDDLSDVDTSTVAPTDGQALVWDNANSQWEPGTVSGGGGATTIDGLTDVDTSTVAPTDGQSLVWDNASSQWKPADGGGAVDSVNSQTGTVSLGFEDLDDYLGQVAAHPSSYHDAKQSDGNWSGTESTTGGYALDNSGSGYDKIYINGTTPTSGTSLAAQGFVAGTTLDLYVSSNGTTFTQHTASNSFDQGSTNKLFIGLSPGLSAYSSATALYFSLTAPGGAAPLVDGDVLQYESSTSKFRPVQLTAVSTRTLLGIGEYVDDAAAGTGGVSSGALYYNTTNSNYVLKT